jgi:hypothetical protein
MLFANKFAPTTFCAGFLNRDLERIVNVDTNWKSLIGQFSFRRVAGNLSTMLRELEPLSGGMTRALWVETKSEWTAYFDNSINGSDPYGPISYMSRLLSCRGVTVSCFPDIEGQSYGQTRFDLWGQEPVNAFNCTRSIGATHDGDRWSWDIEGEPLPFERTETYSRKRIKDRFPPELAIEYCLALGVNPFDESFYGQSGVLVENLMISSSKCRTETYEQSRSRFEAVGRA